MKNKPDNNIVEGFGFSDRICTTPFNTVDLDALPVFMQYSQKKILNPQSVRDCEIISVFESGYRSFIY